MLKVVEEALKLPVRKLPMPLRREYSRFSPHQQRQLEFLTQLRDEKARELNMDPTLIASRADLVGCVRSAETCHLTDWQKSTLGFDQQDGKWIVPSPPAYIRQKKQRKRRPFRKPSRSESKNGAPAPSAPVPSAPSTPHVPAPVARVESAPVK